MTDLLDPTTDPYWSAAAEGKLAVQRCGSCGRHQLYPRPFCIGCTSADLAWVEASGSGTVYSCVTVHLPVHDELPPPYTVALVELDEGPRLLGPVPDGVSIGDRVVAQWRQTDERPVLSFGRAS
ncbi:Zn-ribbon domain-containing OB-fold protein [Amycolatopsis jejuensis]|uniref:Zn-ribbon domain-containing OB-fold protein n=1 Tax=Amycolatopsis jejuensis TaxID=330084 RepID=UPI000527BEDA|nr:Zn-ribbon domain-containing OB-fold protein [Amycolatopsis jejuensis]